MKKIIFGLFASCAFTFAEAVADQPDDSYWPDNIRVEDVLFPTTDKGRNEIAIANLDRTSGKVDISFAEAVDEVVVSIVEQNTGMIVSQSVCNTEIEPATTLDAPQSEGSFVLHIKSDSYEGIGYFEM